MALNIKWEADPLVFMFHKEMPGKVKMHTRKMEWQDWVKIDCTYPAQMKLRDELETTEKLDVFVSSESENTMEAKYELLDTLVEYLPQRFPDIFKSRDGGIYNTVLDRFISADRSDPIDPLIRAGKLTQEDWCILEFDEAQDAYILTAGIVYFPMRWSLRAKFMKPIALIHEPVKGFAKHLVTKVYDLFKTMTPNTPVWRANWAVFNDLTGPLDLYTPLGHTARNNVNKPTEYCGELTGHKLTFRAEYQTLRKLPNTKAIVFGIRTYQRYLEEFKSFPKFDTEGLISAIESLDDDLAEYKGAVFWKDAALQYLKKDVLPLHSGSEAVASDGEPNNIKDNQTGLSLLAFSWKLSLTAVLLGSALAAGFSIMRRS